MVYKELYVFNKEQPIKAVIRNYVNEDFPSLIDIQKESFPPPFPSDLWWNYEQLTNHVKLFPEGALCLEIAGELVGSMTGVIVEFDPNHPDHSWSEITDEGYIRNHNPKGNTLYVVDICIKPTHRKHGLGKWLMQTMYEIVVHKDLDRLLGGGRMPGYHKKSSDYTASEYVDHVVSGSIKDQVITFLLRCGRIPLTVVPNYLDDEESCNYAVLMEWKNPFR